MKLSNAALLILTGIAVGAIAGVLLAPEEGTQTSKKLLKKAKKYKKLLDDKVTDYKKKAADLNKQQVIDRLRMGYEYAENALKNFNKQTLSDSVTFFAGPMNRLQIINLLNDHQTHHRAQVLVYLRLNGIKPPDYVGW